MIRKITYYAVYADQTQDNGEVVRVKSEAQISPRIKSTYDLEIIEEALMIKTGKKHKIVMWYPRKNIYTFFPKIRAILNKQKSNGHTYNHRH